MKAKKKFPGTLSKKESRYTGPIHEPEMPLDFWDVQHDGQLPLSATPDDEGRRKRTIELFGMMKFKRMINDHSRNNPAEIWPYLDGCLDYYKINGGTEKAFISRLKRWIKTVLPGYVPTSKEERISGLAETFNLHIGPEGIKEVRRWLREKKEQPRTPKGGQAPPEPKTIDELFSDQDTKNKI